MLKKFLLSGLVVVAFAIYSIHQRHEGSSVAARPAASSPVQSTPTTTPNNASPSGSSSSGGTATVGAYKDGQYTGSTADAFYGPIQVEVVISGGKLTDVRFLQSPNDSPNSVEINAAAKPILRQEAIKAQTAKVDIVSGATDTSQAFIQSLSVALSQATT